MNSTRWALHQRFDGLNAPLEFVSRDRAKFNRSRLNSSKTDAFDACNLEAFTTRMIPTLRLHAMG